MTAAIEHVPASARARGLVLAFSAGLIMSTNGLLLRLVEDADQWQIIVFRSGSLALTVLAILAVRYRLRLLHVFRSIGWMGLLGGMLLGISYPSYVLSLLNTTVANALFLMSTSPVIAALLGLIFLGEAVRGTTWLAIFGTIVGVLIMVYDGLEGGGMFGNAVALLNAFLYAVYTMLARRNRRVDMTPALVIGGFIGSGIGMLGASSFVLTPHDLGLCLVMGGVQLMLGFTLITLAAQRAPIAEVNLVAMIEMVAGPIIVWLGVGELPSDLTLFGGAIVIMSVGGLALSSIIESQRAVEAEARALARARPVPAVATGARGPTRDERGTFAAALREAEARVDARLATMEEPKPSAAALAAAPAPALASVPSPVEAPVMVEAPAAMVAEPPHAGLSAALAELRSSPMSAPPEEPPREPRPAPQRPRGPIIRSSVERELKAALEPLLRAWVEANVRRLVAPILRREIRALVRAAERPDRR